MRGFLSVRTRFLFALILPFLGVLGVGLVLFSNIQASLLAAQHTANLVDLAPSIDVAVEAFSDESAAAVKLLAGEITEAEFDVAAARVDQVSMFIVSTFTKAGRDISPEVVDYVERRGEENPQAQSQLRLAIKKHQIDPATVITAYGQLTQELGMLPGYLADQVEDRDLAIYLDAYSSTVMSLDSLRITSGIMEVVALNPELPTGGNLLIASSIRADSNFSNAERYLSFLPEKSIQLPVLPEALQTLRDQVLVGQSGTVSVDELAALKTALDEQGAEYQAVGQEIQQALRTRSEQQISSLQTERLVTVLGFVGLLMASIGVSLFFARSVLRPLNRLTQAATDLGDQLPEIVALAAAGSPIPDTATPDVDLKRRDEIGALSRAFTSVNATAIHVAKEQAALRSSLARTFVSIARRDSVLVNRQLAYLDEYERSEESPTVLSRLFALDHLATQMRRNNESLLIISGADTGTRFRGTVAMTDVIRSAISEIDQFERITFSTEVNKFDSPMHGHIARHAIHLFAELLENATRYSPPTSAVQITARADGDVVRVIIRDQGIGMSDEELATANDRVRISDFSEVPDVDHLGLTVVARLRARCHAVVDFTRPAYGQGLLVCVSMPISSFIIKDAQQPAPKSNPAVGPSYNPSNSESPLGTMETPPQYSSPSDFGSHPGVKDFQVTALGDADGLPAADTEAVQLFLNDSR